MLSDRNLVIVDQAIVSAVQLLVTLTLAKLLAPEQFGVFSIFWLIILLVQLVIQSTIVSAFNALHQKYDFDLSGHFFLMTVVVSLASFVILLSVAPIFEDLNVEADFFYVLFFAAYLVGHCLYHFARRLYFLKGLVVSVLFLDLSNSVLKVLALAVYYIGNYDSGAIIWLLLAVASFLSFLPIIQNHLRFENISRLSEICGRTWDFSRWMIPSVVFEWVNSNSLLLIAGGVIGPVAVGTLRVAQAVMGLASLVLQIAESRIPLQSAKILSFGGKDEFRKYIVVVARKLAVLVFFLGAVLAIFSYFFIPLIYGESYASSTSLCWIYLPIYIVMGLRFPLEVAFKTIERTREIFISNFMGFIVTLVLGYYCVSTLGVYGVLLTMLLSRLVAFVHLKYQFNNSTGSI
jgi:O-antigen/teichoic acid export membrane protein